MVTSSVTPADLDVYSVPDETVVSASAAKDSFLAVTTTGFPPRVELCFRGLDNQVISMRQEMGGSLLPGTANFQPLKSQRVTLQTTIGQTRVAVYWRSWVTQRSRQVNTSRVSLFERRTTTFWSENAMSIQMCGVR